MLTPFRLGLGGRVGSGKQYWSWISRPDLVSVFVWALEGDVSGTVNAVAPQQVTSAEFTKALGSVLGRPTVFPLPAFAVRVLFGARGEDMLLGGQRALPTRLEQAGFTFAHPDIEAGLRSALGRAA
jgi:NAD dependent epimerase/dehydratase family enzyme